jgi:NADP-reducing hydrogenase subunit HndB
MTRKMTKADLDAVRATAPAPARQYIKVGLSSCGIAAGADEVFAVLTAEVDKRKLSVAVKPCGCSGACHAEPLVEVCIDGLPVVTYGRVTPDVAMRILEDHVRDKRLVQDYIVDVPVRR